jgi:hypothetical protein
MASPIFLRFCSFFIIDLFPLFLGVDNLNWFVFSSSLILLQVPISCYDPLVKFLFWLLQFLNPWFLLGSFFTVCISSLIVSLWSFILFK